MTLIEVVASILVGLLGWGLAALFKLPRPKVWGIVAFALMALNFIFDWFPVK